MRATSGATWGSLIPEVVFQRAAELPDQERARRADGLNRQGMLDLHDQVVLSMDTKRNPCQLGNRRSRDITRNGECPTDSRGGRREDSRVRRAVAGVCSQRRRSRPTIRPGPIASRLGGGAWGRGRLFLIGAGQLETSVRAVAVGTGFLRVWGGLADVRAP